MGKRIGQAAWIAALALAVAAPAWTLAGTEGYIYGTVETVGGDEYTGLMRWGDEETFWGDLFNASKEERPHRDAAPVRRERGGLLRLFRGSFDWHDDRQVVTRFGDIREIRLDGRHSELLMKNGSVIPFEDSSNDVGGSITVWHRGLGEIELRWRRIARVVFAPTPEAAVPPGYRLWGRVATTRGAFEGYIQWDGEECLSSDELDGETRDGDVSIQFRQIAAIEKNDRNGAWVELTDGRRLLLEDTNDVDDSIYGIFVEDARFGRVLIPWRAFERVDFEPRIDSGPSYADFGALPRELRGTVTTVDGDRLQGAVILDLDEGEGWELLNGYQDHVEYYIPLAQVASITPRGRHASRVLLRNGEELVLEDSVDVSDDGDGVLVLANGSETFVDWRDLERIDFD